MTARSRSGSTAAEFALVIVPLLSLFFGAFEFGRVIWMQNALQQTAIETARCMGVHQALCATGGVVDTAKSVTYARARAGAYHLTIPAGDVAVTASGSCAGQAGFALVTITSTFTTGMALMTSRLGITRSVVGKACFPNQS